MVFKYHPDNKVGEKAKELCNKQMMVINGAYKVLKDQNARNLYDAKRKNQTSNVQKPFDKNSNSVSNKENKNEATHDNEVKQSYNVNYTEENKFETANFDSLFEIISEMWTDVKSNNGENLIRDVNDFFLNNKNNDVINFYFR
jgi:DnaJ-class molecular chaperone